MLVCFLLKLECSILSKGGGAYPGAQTQPLMQGEDGAQVKFMAKFVHVISQFTPPAGNSGSGNLQSKYTFPAGQA